MYKNLLFFYFVSVFIFLGLSGKTQPYSTLDQLVSVNNEWKNQIDVPVQLQNEPAKTLNEQQLVQLHLSETETLLRNRDVSMLSAQQKINRIKNLNVLHEYLEAGLFPINTGHYNRQPYFIDDNNTYCAVGYLMKESGADDMAKDIHCTQNFSYLKDIHHDKLMSWIHQSGLSIDELALIQPGYSGDLPATFLEFHYNNTGTDVNEYIEVRQGAGIGGQRFNSILFYNSDGQLYKTLPITDMKSDNSNSPLMYYYVFGANESFADSGKVELRNEYNSTSGSLISSITYNADSVNLMDYIFYSNGITYPLGENESTPINSSLTFCGTYPGSWQLYSLPSTIGILNSCVDLIVPIILGDFSFAIKQNTVDLSWQTLTETNNKEFVIERSGDGYHFKQIGTIAAAGNSSSGKQYNFTDAHPEYINYYRLKQVDIDGKNSYFKVLYVKVEGASPFILHQTLVNTDLRYENKLAVVGAQIEIYSFNGSKVYSHSAGTGVCHINISSLANGKYFIRLLAGNGQVYTKQFMKQTVL